jgi:uracil-DNA glycosylase
MAHAELRMVAPSLRVIVCVGRFARNALWPVLGDRGYRVSRARPAFGHGAEITVGSQGADGASPPATMITTASDCSSSAAITRSQQNTFTGRVTPGMMDAIFTRARDAAGLC